MEPIPSKSSPSGSQHSVNECSNGTIRSQLWRAGADDRPYDRFGDLGSDRRHPCRAADLPAQPVGRERRIDVSRAILAVRCRNAGPPDRAQRQRIGARTQARRARHHGADARPRRAGARLAASPDHGSILGLLRREEVDQRGGQCARDHRRGRDRLGACRLVAILLREPAVDGADRDGRGLTGGRPVGLRGDRAHGGVHPSRVTRLGGERGSQRDLPASAPQLTVLGGCQGPSKNARDG